MTGAPPSEAPQFQVNLIVVAEVEVPSFCRSTGASGTNYITAPFPNSEQSDCPYALTAIILT